MVKASRLAVKIIGEMFETKGTVNRKVGSGHPRASTTKDNHRLKTTVLKGIRKYLLNIAKNS